MKLRSKSRCQADNHSAAGRGGDVRGTLAIIEAEIYEPADGGGTQ